MFICDNSMVVHVSFFPRSNGEGFLQGDELKTSNIPQSAWSCRGYDGSKLKFPYPLVME